MPVFAETSVIVRYLTADPPEMGRRAARIIETDEDVWLTETILAESSHVLRSVYGLNRENVVDILLRLLRRRNIGFHGMDKSLAIAALQLTRPSGRVSVPDALVWAAAHAAAPATVYTFDRRFPSEGIEVREPPDD